MIIFRASRVTAIHRLPSIFLTLCMSKSRDGAGAGDSSSAAGGGSMGGSPSSSSKYHSY